MVDNLPSVWVWSHVEISDTQLLYRLWLQIVYITYKHNHMTLFDIHSEHAKTNRKEEIHDRSPHLLGTNILHAVLVMT